MTCLYYRENAEEPLSRVMMAHRAICPECRQWDNDLHSLRNVLRSATPVLPPGIWEKTRVALERENRKSRSFIWSGKMRLGLALAAMILIALGIFWQRPAAVPENGVDAFLLEIFEIGPADTAESDTNTSTILDQEITFYFNPEKEID